MSAPTASSLFAAAGTKTYGFFDKKKFGVIRGRASMVSAAATATIAQQLPANAKVKWAQANVSSAVGLTTALRYGIGTTADPDAFLISGLTMTAGTVSKDPSVGDGVYPIFSNSVIGTTGTSGTANTSIPISVFSGQTVAPIPANFLKPGDIIRMRGCGTLVQGGSSTCTIKVLGGTAGTDVVLASGAPTIVSGDIFTFDCDMVIRSIGAGGSTTAGAFTSSGRTYVGTAGSAAGAADIPSAGLLALTALDTTSAFTPTVSAFFSGSTDGSTAIMNNFSIEVIRPALPVSSSATTLVLTTLSNAGISTGSSADSTGTVDFEIGFEELEAIATA